MHELGVEQVFVDRMSGKNTDRPELKRMMSFVREGDTVIVEAISRFARNTKDLLDLVEQLTEVANRGEAAPAADGEDTLLALQKHTGGDPDPVTVQITDGGLLEASLEAPGALPFADGGCVGNVL